ncbi:hypothetical protein FG87_29675 [Nocardia vulneris]|uniref:Uncharacterized protein n=1 Tax=Nocardia vulneris TaxID=1141657 RepID=A0ABR4Z8K5_9NOCA|nr:hypothetical protein FG87_29675 [Nocardia vulneris]
MERRPQRDRSRLIPHAHHGPGAVPVRVRRAEHTIRAGRRIPLAAHPIRALGAPPRRQPVGIERQLGAGDGRQAELFLAASARRTVP